MTAPTLSLQGAMRAALIADTAMTDLVPASQIFDRHARPETFPCIVIGEVQEVADDMSLARDKFRLYPTLHVWTREPGLISVKAICWQIRRTLIASENVRLGLIDWRYNDTRILRDPDGVTGHGVVTFEALLGEALL
ncbi:hypothetical protein AMST5_01449 [freshwater sediment metagenome]|uniref:DUF3168 domain-containing protein n=1 Tax=freshwater sediment metagenome TaxID=556182 RepID=A0AA48LYE3_9ZZZZ